MKYRITVEKIEEFEDQETEWVKKYNDDVYLNLLNLKKLKEVEEQYGYVGRTVTKVKTDRIFDQTRDVENFDLKAVIDAFNK